MATNHHRGLSASEALERTSIYAGGVTCFDVEAPQNSRWEPLQDSLRRRDWHATGYLVQGQGKPPKGPDAVEPECWNYLRLYRNGDSAGGGGVEYVGLRFHPGEPPQKPKQTARAEKDCLAWLIGVMKQPRGHTITSLQGTAEALFTGLSDKAFRHGGANHA